MSSRIIKSAGQVSGYTFISRIFGLARDVLIANIFGAGAGYDAFLIAFKIPNFTRRLFAEGAFSQAFIPVLSEVRAKKNKYESLKLAGNLAGCLLLVTGLITLLVIIFAPLVVSIFAPGFIHDNLRFDLAVYMLRITFAYALLISLVSLAGSVLNVWGYFMFGAASPILLNISLICSAFFLSNYLTVPITSLAWGVLAGGFLQLLWMIYGLRKKRLFGKIRFTWKDHYVRKVLKLMVPALFAASIVQFNIMLDSVFASLLDAGSVSWLYYADRLIELPVGVFGIALATVALANLSHDHAAGNHSAYVTKIDWSVRMILIIGVPATIGLFMLAEPLLITLFNYGKFSYKDITNTSMALRAYSLGLLSFLIVKILSSAFYAVQDVKFPFKVAVICTIFSVVANLAFIPFFKHAGIALATVTATTINCGLLMHKLRKEGTYITSYIWSGILLRIGFAALVMATAIWYFNPEVTSWLAWSAWDRLVHLLSFIAGMVLLYFFALYIAGMRLKDFKLVV